MSESREIVTDRLVNVINGVLLSQQNGTLYVERGGGASRESGMIIFAKGKVLDAQADGRSGQDALRWLRTWRACRYRFVRQTSTIDPPQSTPSTPSVTERLNRFIRSANLFPSNNANQVDSPVEQGTDPNIVPLGLEQNSPVRDTGPHRFQEPTTGPHWVWSDAEEQQHTNVESLLPSHRGSLDSIPVRLPHNDAVLERMEMVGLTRAHRHLFLLINGKRTVKDLAWLTKHTPAEVQVLLDDLQRVGFIRQS